MMARCTRSVFRSSIKYYSSSAALWHRHSCLCGFALYFALYGFALALFAAGAWAQLPDAPGKEETQKICKHCHEIERSVAPRQDREGWQGTMDKMVALGAEITDKEYTTILDYLAKNFPAAEIPKLNINKARPSSSKADCRFRARKPRRSSSTAPRTATSNRSRN